MTDEARAAQREYYKQWRAAHKDNVREANRRYWQKKAEQKKLREEEADAANKTDSEI